MMGMANGPICLRTGLCRHKSVPESGQYASLRELQKGVHTTVRSIVQCHLLK